MTWMHHLFFLDSVENGGVWPTKGPRLGEHMGCLLWLLRNQTLWKVQVWTLPLVSSQGRAGGRGPTSWVEPPLAAWVLTLAAVGHYQGACSTPTQAEFNPFPDPHRERISGIEPRYKPSFAPKWVLPPAVYQMGGPSFCMQLTQSSPSPQRPG